MALTVYVEIGADPVFGNNTDVTANVVAMSISEGRSSPLERFSPTQITIDLDNSAGTYDTPGSQLQKGGYVSVGVDVGNWVGIRLSTVSPAFGAVFGGRITSMVQRIGLSYNVLSITAALSYDSDLVFNTTTTPVNTSGMLTFLANTTEPNATQAGADIGVAATVTVAATTTVLELFQSVADVSRGVGFAYYNGTTSTQYGYRSMRGRAIDRVALGSVPVFGNADDNTEIPCWDVELVKSDDALITSCTLDGTAFGVAGSSATYSSSTAASTYGRRPLSRSSPQPNASLASWAQTLVGVFGTPRFVVRSLTTNGRWVPDAAWAHLLNPAWCGGCAINIRTVNGALYTGAYYIESRDLTFGADGDLEVRLGVATISYGGVSGVYDSTTNGYYDACVYQ